MEYAFCKRESDSDSDFDFESYCESDSFDSLDFTMDEDEQARFDDIIVRSQPKPARVKREIERATEPFKPSEQAQPGLLSRYSLIANSIVYDKEIPPPSG